MLREIHPGLVWAVDGPFSKMGFDVGARMTVVRLGDGGLWLHSPLEPEDSLRPELDALGPVRFLIAPSGMHYLGVPASARAFPEAEVYAASGASTKLREVRVTGVLGDEPPPGWAGEIDQVPFRGSRLYDEVVFFHRASRTLLLTDLCFNLRGKSGTTRLWAKALGIDDRFAMSASFGLTVKDRGQVRESLARILKWDFDRIVVTHGEVLETGGREAFRAAVARHL